MLGDAEHGSFLFACCAVVPVPLPVVVSVIGSKVVKLTAPPAVNGAERVFSPALPEFALA